MRIDGRGYAALGAIVLLAACGGGGSAADETVINELDPDPAYEAANDVSIVDNAMASEPGNASGAVENAIDNAIEATENAQNALEEAKGDAAE